MEAQLAGDRQVELAIKRTQLTGSAYKVPY